MFWQKSGNAQISDVSDLNKDGQNLSELLIDKKN